MDKEDGRGNSGNEDSSDTEPKGSLNLLDGGLKSGKEGIWGATNLTVKNLEPCKPYTIVVEYEYEYIGADGKPKTEKHKIAIDGVSDENGTIDLYRVGVIKEKGNNSKYKDLEKKDMKININISEVEGSVRDNYGDVDNLDPNDKSKSQGEKESFKSKYGLGAYAAEHASQDKWLNTPKPDNYGGGGIDDMEDPDVLKKVARGTIKYNKDSKKMEIEGDIENTGRGKGRNTDK